MATQKPNIVVIWGDDIGQANISAYSDGLMGYKTPNIDRVAKEGVMFTDSYAEQSCTAGRSSFITGQCGFRTGNTKVGMPGAAQGLQHRDVTIAQLLKAQGYATGQFGKNHLGQPKIIRTSSITMGRAAFWIARRRTWTTRRWIRVSARSASRPSRTPAR